MTELTAYDTFTKILETSFTEAMGYFSQCVNLMDEDLMSEIYSMDLNIKAEFLKIYCQKHLGKYQEVFIVN